ncbi:MAG: hypothetical protein WD711_12955 [Dongiaceae bacterium]
MNYELPNVPESYVHRIGRTARAGATGIAVAFCDPAERGLLRDIERLIGRALPKQGADGVAVAVDAEPIGRMPVRESREGSSRCRGNGQNKRGSGKPNGQRTQNGAHSGNRKNGGRQADAGKSAAAGDGPRGERANAHRRNGRDERQANSRTHGRSDDRGNDRRNARSENERHRDERRAEARPGNEAEDAGLARMLGAQSTGPRNGNEPRRRRAA